MLTATGRENYMKTKKLKENQVEARGSVSPEISFSVCRHGCADRTPSSPLSQDFQSSQHAAVGQRLELSCPASILKGLHQVPLCKNAEYPNPETSGDGEFTLSYLAT